MEVMMGLPVEGLPVIGKTNLIWEEECERLLGVKPPAPVPKPNQNKSVLDGTRIKSKWLANRFRAPLPKNASEDLVQQYARYYLLELLGGSLFMDTSGGRISLLYLQFLDPISDAKKYSWGSAALAWLYRQLCNATDLKAKHISGALLLVQLWAFSRFPHMVPKMKEPLQGALDQELPLGPHAIRWQGAKCTKNAPTHVLEAYRASFSTTQAHQIVWEPYKEVLSTLPTYCTAGQRVWRSVVPLICFWIVEFHHPERVLRQFGMQQGEPPIVNTSVKLHRISLRAKMDKDWRKEHAVYIQKWDSRDQRVHDAPVFDGVMQYNHSYMKWYRRITRCHISHNSAKWDIIVNTQLRMLSRCQPNSENYKDIMDVLNLVGEMNRVNLDSACTVSSTRTSAAGHGGRSGGRGRRRGGRGGRRGGCGFGCGSSHDQEHSDSDEYPPSAADTDSDSDYGLSIDDTGIRPCMIHDDIGPSTTHDAPPSPLPTTLHDDIGPSYTHDASSSPLPLTPNDDTEPSTTHGTPWFPLPPTPMSATLTTNVASTDLAGGSSRIFIPILGLPTPHHHFPTRSAQIHSLPKPQQEVARVEQPHSENVEQLEPPPPKYLKRTRNEESSCGTGEEIALETTTMDDCAASLASLSSASTGDTTDCALACPSNSLPTQLTTTSIAEQNPSSLLVQQQVPTLTWPKNSELDLDWIENLISIFDWSSKNLPPSEFPLVLPVQAFDTLILTASKILHKEPNCITIDPVESSSVVVVGDIHGQLHDLIFLLKHAGFPSQNRFFVFNGDYVDRGAWGLESFLLLLAWKVFMPDRVFLLRGNHESKYCTSNYGFEKEVLTKYGDSGKHVYRKCLGCFEELPLASIIAGCVYTAHGGLFRSIPLVPSKRSKRKKRRRVSFNSEPKSLSLGSLEELSGARRSVLDPPWEGLNLIPGDVLWSDPSMTPGLSLNEERGIGLLWGPDCTEDFLKKFNLKLIIRSHEGPDAREKRTGFGGMDEGYTIDHVVESGKLITVFSAPDYPQFQAGEERYKNKGAYVVLEPPNFDNPKFYSFEAVAPRPQVNPYYDYVDVIDSDEELDLASMATSAYQ